MRRKMKNNHERLKNIFSEAYKTCARCDEKGNLVSMSNHCSYPNKLRRDCSLQTRKLLAEALYSPNDIEDNSKINDLMDLCVKCEFKKPLVALALEKDYSSMFTFQQ